MRPVRVTTDGVSVSAPIPCDQYLTPFNLGIGVVITGTPTYKVQHTFDDVFAAGYDPATGAWFDHSALVGLSADGDGNYAFPVTAVRLNQTAGVAGNGATMVVLQAGVR